MEKSALYWKVYDRLVADEGIDADAAALVDAAMEGDAALAAAVAGTRAATPLPPVAHDRAPGAPPGAYLSRLRVAGFRGVADPVTLELDPGPGLHVIVGRNGSGKSSLAEGLETLLTGGSRRWEGRPKAWKDGWRNLHATKASLDAVLVVEGESEPVVAERSWGADDALEAAALRLRAGTRPLGGLRALGWDEPLVAFRPFLSYNELGGLIDAGPSKLYDSLKGILGLEEVAVATERLRQVRLERERAVKAVKAAVVPLLDALEKSTDPRAARCHAALNQKKFDLETVADVLTSAVEDTRDAEVQTLRRLASLRAPSAQDAQAAATGIRAAVAALAKLAATRAERDRQTAALLTTALAWQQRFAEADCPVCGRQDALDPDWRERVRQQVTALEAAATEARGAVQAVDRAVALGRQLIRGTPAVEDTAVIATHAARAAREAWGGGADTLAPLDLADRLESGLAPLAAALDAVRGEAAQRLEAMQSAWKPLAERLALFLPQAREARAGFARIAQLKAAEAWLVAAEGALRDARFEPIAEQAQAVWRELRQHSNVDLVRIALAGTTTRRHVELDVTVDDTAGVALGVMSQGELHALALSLFLPRLTLDESPFRFLVIDDPVQAMDPHKVDGLARVLADTAKTRQVVVFTHDARLPEAIRRLGIEARIQEVTRRTGSQVELRVLRDPVEQYLADAYQVTDHALKIGPWVAAGVVPGLCRTALEAAFTRVARRKLLGRGLLHSDVEGRIDAVRSTIELAALALFEEAHRGNDVYAWLNREVGTWAPNHIKALNAGAHEGHEASLKSLVDNTRYLALRLLRP